VCLQLAPHSLRCLCAPGEWSDPSLAPRAFKMFTNWPGQYQFNFGWIRNRRIFILCTWIFKHKDKNCPEERKSKL
jgi:hypothetical protein